MSSDEEDFVFVGTAIEREEEVTTRRKKAIAEAAGNLRTLAPWKQEVLDEEGRRRFHGAFTGGYSAGYYNTVGSKEGWAPQTFTSSRKNRAEIKNQSVLNFLDEDEKSEFESQLGTSSKFDTFGFTAAEHARKQADKEQQQRPSAIPGPAPDEIVVPVTESIGMRLLLKMGWRHGHSIKDLRGSSKHDARRESRKAFLAFAFSSHGTKDQTNDDEPAETAQQIDSDVPFSQKTPVFVTNPKQDLHGLGYDPFKHAPEFRENKRLRTTGKKDPGYQKTIKDSLFGLKSGKTAPGFGIGALEDYDAEDEDVYESGYNFEETYIQEEEEPLGLSIENKPSKLSIESKPSLVAKDSGLLPGFKLASQSDYQMERFEPPVVPKDFVPHHKFPPQSENTFSVPPPPDFPPPDDNNRKLLIEGVATLVARCGKLYEDLSRDKNQSNPLFSFLNGGIGHEYYARKLWEEQQKCKDQVKLPLDSKSSKNNDKMTAESRGKLLGEKPLERTSTDSKPASSTSDIQLQYNLSDTFTTTAYNKLAEISKPFKADPAKQERFEQFLKEKYRGGLRSTGSGGTSHMSEAARARERLDFESAAETLSKGKSNNESNPSGRDFMDLLASGGMQFTSGGVEQGKDTQIEDEIAKKMYPKREEFQWRPSPVLCKRFDLTDPYMGKAPAAPRMRRKIDTLIFTSDAVKDVETALANSDAKSDALNVNNDESNKEMEVEVEVEIVERPVDLYKAIFSDDSDDEPEVPILNKNEDPEKKIEVANATLNRLIAGDFLESLGKELGMELPPELPYSSNKAPTQNANTTFPSPDKKGSSSPDPEPSKSRWSPHNDQEAVLNEKKPRVDKKDKKSSSEDERSRKRSREKHRYRSSDSFSDSFDDYRDRHHSRSKERRKESSRDKSSSRKQSKKHRKRESRESPPSKSRHVSVRTEEKDLDYWKMRGCRELNL
ncbi:hypothetical protein ACFE04_006619 [Oxalis oulophora]